MKKFLIRWNLKRKLRKLDKSLKIVVENRKKDQSSFCDWTIQLEGKKLHREHSDKIWRLRFLIAKNSLWHKIIIEHIAYNMSETKMPPLTEIYQAVFGVPNEEDISDRKFKRNKEAISIFLDFAETYLGE